MIRAHYGIADLLIKEKMEELAEASGIQGFLDRLEETPYGEISVEGEERVPMALEKVFYEKFVERIQQIVKFTPTKMGDFLRAYYDMRFEVVNLKRILRGKYSGVDKQEIIDSLIPIESYLAPDHVKLADKESLEDVVDELRDPPYRELGDRMDLYREVGALWPFELTLNTIYAFTILRLVKKLPSQARMIVRRIVSFETDIENVLIAIKQRDSPMGARRRFEEMFPATYHVGIDELKAVMEADDIRHVIEDMPYPYYEILAPLYEGDVALIRSRLRQHIYDIARKARATNDFGFNSVMAYLVFSEIEKDDLVGISWGKTQGVSSEDILRYIATPHS